jgi:hypothetical protein
VRTLKPCRCPAPHTRSDRTIRLVQAFSRRWGMGGAVVCNVFGLRSPDPKALRHHYDPVGSLNDVYLDELALDHHIQVVIAAWGVHATLLNREDEVRQLFAFHGRALDCLGLTKDGHPRHPLYLKGDSEPRAWR